MKDCLEIGGWHVSDSKSMPGIWKGALIQGRQKKKGEGGEETGRRGSKMLGDTTLSLLGQRALTAAPTPPPPSAFEGKEQQLTRRAAESRKKELQERVHSLRGGASTCWGDKGSQVASLVILLLPFRHQGCGLGKLVQLCPSASSGQYVQPSVTTGACHRGIWTTVPVCAGVCRACHPTAVPRITLAPQGEHEDGTKSKTLSPFPEPLKDQVRARCAREGTNSSPHPGSGPLATEDS